MRSILGATQSDCSHPFIEQTRILAGAHVVRVVDTAWEDEVARRATTSLQPGNQACPDIGGQFELYRSTSFLLHDYSAGPYVGTGHKVADHYFHKIAAAKLAVDRQIEKRPVTQSAFSVQEKPDRPNLLLCQRPFRAHRFAGIPAARLCVAGSNSE